MDVGGASDNREYLAHHHVFSQCFFIDLLEGFKCVLREARWGERRPWLCHSAVDFCPIAWFRSAIVHMYAMVDEVLLEDRVIGRRFPGLRGCIRFSSQFWLVFGSPIDLRTSLDWKELRSRVLDTIIPSESRLRRLNRTYSSEVVEAWSHPVLRSV